MNHKPSARSAGPHQKERDEVDGFVEDGSFAVVLVDAPASGRAV